MSSTQRLPYAETCLCIVPVERILSLRHRVLRDGLPPESARFPGDHDSDTLHFAAYETNRGWPKGEPIGCLSLVLSEYADVPAWQLRGMAIEPALQGKGTGKTLLRYALTHVQECVFYSDVNRLWCNARTTAVRFYESEGWRVDSDVFDIPTAGPHVQMVKDW